MIAIYIEMRNWILFPRFQFQFSAIGTRCLNYVYVTGLILTTVFQQAFLISIFMNFLFIILDENNCNRCTKKKKKNKMSNSKLSAYLYTIKTFRINYVKNQWTSLIFINMIIIFISSKTNYRYSNTLKWC